MYIFTKGRVFNLNILVAGCGKVGSCLALELSSLGHDVSVIDSSEENFSLYLFDFNGFTTCASPIDIDSLKNAGIESCDVFCAVTNDDNTNIMAAQLAKEFFGIKKVYARIYDPSKEAVFKSKGIAIICPTSLTVNAVSAAINDSLGYDVISNIGKTVVSFDSMKIPQELIGKRVSGITFEENEVLYAIERNDNFMLVGQNNYELCEGDILVFSKIL